MQKDTLPFVINESEIIDPSEYKDSFTLSLKKVLPGDVAFRPEDLQNTKNNVLATHIVPEGIYARATIFSDSEQTELRRTSTKIVGVLDIMHHEDNPALDDDNTRIELELMRLNAKAAQDRASMVEAARQHHNLSPSDPRFSEKSAQLRRVFEQSQNAIYPEVDESLARETLDRLLGLEAVREPILSAEARAAWQEYLHTQYDPVFKKVYETFPNEKKMDGNYLKAMTEAFMRETGLPMTDDLKDTTKWKVRYEPSASSFTVVPGAKEIIIGARAEPLTRLQFEKLMMHEVVIHAWRQENGSNSGFPVMQTGLPGYLETEEGMGILMESLWSGEDPDNLGRDHYRYVAVAFADGAYDTIRHNEQETFDMIYKLMQKNNVESDTDELHNHVMRVFRGMPPDWRMHSNLSYLAGKIKAMELFEQQFAAGVSIDEQFTGYCAGKYNPCDPEQVAIEQQIRQLNNRKKEVSASE